jgi:ribosome-binding protein aMBF1 (putative translation factor)
MPVAAKTHPINLRFKPKTPARVIRSVKRQFSEYLLDDEDEYVDWFKTDLHAEIAARMKPGDYLRNFREAHGLTQKELSAKLVVPGNYVSDMETGRRPISRMNAKKLAKIFKVNPGVFI